MIDPDFRRFLTAVTGRIPDRVPLAEVLIDHEIKESFLGHSIDTVAADLEFWLNSGYDYIILGRRLAGYPPFWEAATRDSYYDVQAPRVGPPRGRGPVSNRQDFQAYPWPKPTEIDFGIFDDVERHLPPQVKCVRYLGPIFQLVWMLMGFEVFAFALRDDPGLVEAMFDRIGSIALVELEDALQRESVGAVWYLDDIGMKTGLMVSPSVIRRYLFPYMKIIGARCRERGIPFIYHTDGNVESVIPELCEMGVCALHPLEPLAMDIRQVKRQYGGELSLIGGIDLLSVLALGNPESVAREVRACVRDLAPEGGYCIGSSNSVTKDVPLDNFHAMVRAAREFGRYPEQANKEKRR